MKIHEFQAKEILKAYGVPVPRGDVAKTPGKAKKIAEKLGGKVVSFSFEFKGLQTWELNGKG